MPFADGLWTGLSCQGLPRRHLNYFTSRLRQQTIAGVTFHIAPDHQSELATVLEVFFTQPEQHACNNSRG